MDLIEKSIRDEIGIDTFERAIVFSILMLRKGLKQAELPTNQMLIYQTFGQVDGEKITNLTIEAKFPYDSNYFLGLGGDFLYSILPLATGGIAYSGDNIDATEDNSFLIPDEPETVDSLEKYCAWAMTEWIKFNKLKGENNWDSYGYFSFLEEATPSVISAKIILPFDYNKFIDSKNLIASVISSLISPDPDPVLAGWGDLFGNNYLVGN